MTWRFHRHTYFTPEMNACLTHSPENTSPQCFQSLQQVFFSPHTSESSGSLHTLRFEVWETGLCSLTENNWPLIQQVSWVRWQGKTNINAALMWHRCVSATCLLRQEEERADVSAWISGLSPCWLSAGLGQSTAVSSGAKWRSKGSMTWTAEEPPDALGDD